MSGKKDTTQTGEVHNFSKPYEFEGVTYENITLDFDSVLGEDMLEIESILTRQGIGVVMPETSQNFMVHVLSRASKQPVEFFKKMPAKLLSPLRMKAQTFLADLA